MLNTVLLVDVIMVISVRFFVVGSDISVENYFPACILEGLKKYFQENCTFCKVSNED